MTEPRRYRYDLLGAEVHGLKLRHVKSLRLEVEWDDTPPRFIEEQRTGDIVRALRVGFNPSAAYRDEGTTSVPPLPGERNLDNAAAEGRERRPDQPIPGCCGFTRPTGKCCVETDVPSDEEEDDDGGY